MENIQVQADKQYRNGYLYHNDTIRENLRKGIVPDYITKRLGRDLGNESMSASSRTSRYQEEVYYICPDDIRSLRRKAYDRELAENCYYLSLCTAAKFADRDGDTVQLMEFLSAANKAEGGNHINNRMRSVLSSMTVTPYVLKELGRLISYASKFSNKVPNASDMFYDLSQWARYQTPAIRKKWASIYYDDSFEE